MGKDSFLRSEFDRVWPWLEKAVERYGPTHTKQDVLNRILAHQAQLWLAENAAVVTSVETHPTGFTEVHGWLTGGELDGVLDLEKQIENWARGLGCKRMTLIGREGFLRALPNYKKLVTHMAKDISE